MKKKLGVFLLIAVAAIGVTGLDSGTVSAFSNVFPDGADTSGGADVVAINANTRYVRQTNGKIRVWFPNRNGSVEIRFGNFCSGVRGDYVESEDGSYGQWANGAAITRFRVTQTGQTFYGRKGQNCTASHTFNFNNIDTEQNGFYYRDIDIDYVGGRENPFSGAVNGFVIVAPGQPNARIGLPASANTLSNGHESTQDQLNASPTYTNYFVPFGTACNVNTAETARIYMYDLDNAGGSGAQVGRDVTVRLYDRTVGSYVNFDGSSHTGNPGSTWRPANLQNDTQWVSFTARPDRKYRLEVNDVYHNNTIQWSVPYSQIFSLPCAVTQSPPTGSILSVRCNASNGQVIRFTSDDPNGNTQSRIRIGPDASPNYNSGWGADGTRTITVPNGTGGMNFTTGTWRIRLDVRDKLANGNYASSPILNVDTTLSIQCTPTTQEVVVRPIVDTPIDPHIEPTETTNFTGRVNISNFPQMLDDEWGFTEYARQNANNNGSTPQRQTYANQRGAQDTTASNNVSFARLCASGNYNTTCANYRCQDGVARPSCGNYYWRCTWNGNVKYPGWSGSQPACNIFGYYCRGADGNWNTGSNYEYRNFSGNGGTCNNLWVCPSPSAVRGYGSAASTANCYLFNCRNGADPQNFYEPNGNGSGDADRRCDYRCNNGAGNHAPQATPGANNKYGAGDLACYQQPRFTLRCTWDDGDRQDVVVTNNGDYCVRNKQKEGVIIGVNVCAEYDGEHIGAWSPNPPSPGYGSTDGGATFRQITTWLWSEQAPDQKCVRVVAKPTFKVQGGDVAVGGAFTSSGICGASPASSIIGWPHAPNYDASGTEMAGFASRDILGFSTARANTNLAVAPRSLAFANTPVSGGERFGGSFGPMPCIADHNGAKPTGLPGLNLSTLNAPNVDGSYQATTNQINNSPTIGNGRQVSIYVNGDVYISGTGIRYNRTGWITTADIPAFKLVAYGGNIYIENTVTNLDGVYVAQPNGGAGGHIYTCTSGGVPVAGTGYYGANLGDGCRVPLTVNGTFIARQVHLGRSEGTAIFGETSEEFNYLPELWLGNWPQDNTSSSVKYDAIISLPPVL